MHSGLATGAIPGGLAAGGQRDGGQRVVLGSGWDLAAEGKEAQSAAAAEPQHVPEERHEKALSDPARDEAAAEQSHHYPRDLLSQPLLHGEASPREDAEVPEEEVSLENSSDRIFGRWTEAEHKLFIDAYLKYGSDWKRIAEIVGTRTNIQVRTHAQKYVSSRGVKSSSSGGASARADKPTAQPTSSSAQRAVPDVFSHPFVRSAMPFFPQVPGGSRMPILMPSLIGSQPNLLMPNVQTTWQPSYSWPPPNQPPPPPKFAGSLPPNPPYFGLPSGGGGVPLFPSSSLHPGMVTYSSPPPGVQSKNPSELNWLHVQPSQLQTSAGVHAPEVEISKSSASLLKRSVDDRQDSLDSLATISKQPKRDNDSPTV